MPGTVSGAPDAAQRFFSGVRQSRGPYALGVLRSLLGPGSAVHR
ncbi:hypothetical protein ABIB73_007397 [Bradyrhizobium sp. F1.4.3]